MIEFEWYWLIVMAFALLLSHAITYVKGGADANRHYGKQVLNAKEDWEKTK